MSTPISETYEDRVRAINESLLERWTKDAVPVVEKAAPTVKKAGPKGYTHGWVKAVGPISASDLKVKGNGDMVHQPSGNKVGWMKHTDNTGTKKTYAFHGSRKGKATLVYEGAKDKQKALTTMANYHNSRNFGISADSGE